MLIISVMSVLMGLVLLVVPHMKILSSRSVTGSGSARQKTTLIGTRKQIVAGLYIAVGVAGIFTDIPEVAIVIAWVAVHFFAVFFMLDYAPSGLESPRKKTPRVQEDALWAPPLPAPPILPPNLHTQLIKIAEQGPLEFDTRTIRNYSQERKATWEACNTLFRMRLISRDWTGPGECIHIFTINDAGKEMLAEMAQDAVEDTPESPVGPT